MLLSANIAVSQINEAVLNTWSYKAAADINNTSSANVEQFADPLGNFKNAKNEFIPYKSTVSVGTSVLASKYVSIYSLPISFSFKTKLLFRSNEAAYENIGVKLVVPITHKMIEDPDLQPSKNTITGFGDVNLKLNYLVKLQKTVFSLSILSKLPTAKISKKEGDGNIPLGTGSTDIGLSAFCSREMTSRISAYGSIGYDYRAEFTTVGIYYDNGNNTGKTYEYGKRLFAMIGGEYYMNAFSAGADFRYTSIANDNIIQYYSAYKSPGITAFDIMPYIRMNLPHSITASISTIIPVKSKYNSDAFPTLDADRKIKVGISITYKFARKSES